jgi:uncharacterized membrane protein YciS (DUF1049 family)
MSQVRVAERKRGRRAYAAVGFILIVAIAVIVVVVTPPLTTYLDQTFLRRYQIPRRDLPTVQLLVGLILFFIGATITALIVALFAPKKSINVKETDLVKEREQMVKQRKADRVRQRQINREFRDFREGKTDGKKPKRR